MTVAFKSIPNGSHEENTGAVAKAYNEAGDRYQTYADGDLDKLYAFGGRYSFGDRQTWAVIEQRLHKLRLSGARSLRILDLGCGPGTWIRRTVACAQRMGFTDITARGVDLSDFQIRRARTLSRGLAARPDMHLSFEVGDIRGKLPEPDKSVDLCLCLYGVINHLAVGELDAFLREISRVTSGGLIATVRTIGSTPTIYVDAVSTARNFRQNNDLDRLEVEFQSGKLAAFHSHLFSRAEIRALVTPFMNIEDLRGLDLFHGRFAGDRRWNPPRAASTDKFMRELAALESRYSHDPEFMDHATHLLIVAGPAR